MFVNFLLFFIIYSELLTPGYIYHIGIYYINILLNFRSYINYFIYYFPYYIFKYSLYTMYIKKTLHIIINTNNFK
jgi:hypothetical protein